MEPEVEAEEKIPCKFWHRNFSDFSHRIGIPCLSVTSGIYHLPSANGREQDGTGILQLQLKSHVLSSNPLCQVYMSFMSHAINMFLFDSCTWNPHLFDESSLSFPDLVDSVTAPSEGYGLGGSLWTVECHGLRVTAGAVAVSADVKVREPCGGLVGFLKSQKELAPKCFDLLEETSQCFFPFSGGSYIDHSSTVQH